MGWFDQMFGGAFRPQYGQEQDDGMGSLRYGPFYQLWLQRQQQAQPQPWQGKNPGHIPTPWTGGPGPDVPTPWVGQQPAGPDVPTPWVGQPQPMKPPMQMQPMAQRRPPTSGVIRR